MPDFLIENKQALMGRHPVAGIDEAGRGPWAGPVVAAAVILNPEACPPGLDDSKKLTAKKRAALYPQIFDRALVGIGLASVEEIDRLNILQATLLAMSRAVQSLPESPGCLLVDGNHTPKTPIPAEAVVKGDSKSLSIAAASIVAKVKRDQIMRDLAKEYPAYGWETNAGYGTQAHRQALNMVGISPHHRKSFAPIRQLMTQESSVTF